LPQSSFVLQPRPQNENPVAFDQHASQLSIVQAAPTGTRQVLNTVLQLFDLQSESVEQEAPMSRRSTQPTPAWHRWVLGQPQSAHCLSSVVCVHATGPASTHT